MIPTELVWQALGRPPQPKELKKATQDTCCFCGVHQGDVRKQDVFSGAFTNWDRLMNPSSDAVCLYCFTCLRGEHSRQLRISSWLATPTGLKTFKRGEIAGVLFGEKETPFCIYATTSFKKIGVVKVVVNNNPRRFQVQLEEVSTIFDMDEHRELWETMRLFYSMPVCEQEKKQPKSFFTKAEIQTGAYQMHRIKDFGLLEWREKERIIAKYRGSGIMQLLIYALNQEKLGRAKIEKKEKPSGKKEVSVTDGDAGKRTEGKRAKRETAGKRTAKASVGKGSGISDLASDKLGQCVFWPEDEDL